MRYVDSDDYDFDREIPGWLQRGEEHDAVDWETVAAYAVLKPRMACLLARVLIARLDRRLGRPEGMARAHSAKQANEIEAAWKWIDRNADERITPLFKMSAPPRPLTPEDIEAFPLLAPGISLRMDIEPWWNRKRKLLILARDGVRNLLGVKAASAKAAIKILRVVVPVTDNPEVFHYWPMQNKADAEETSEPLKPSAFAKPWEVLSRVGAKTFHPH
jgi:hypothetical protein